MTEGKIVSSQDLTPAIPLAAPPKVRLAPRAWTALDPHPKGSRLGKCAAVVGAGCDEVHNRLVKRPMRILATADIHGNCAVYRAIRTLGEERQVEALVLAGDLLGMPDGLQTVEEAQRANGREICKVFSGLKIPVLYIMGNDDLVELEPPGRPYQSIHGRRVDLEPYNFVGYQFSLPFNGRRF